MPAKKQAAFEATELRKGQKQLQLEDFVDPEAAKDPGHFEPHAKLQGDGPRRRAGRGDLPGGRGRQVLHPAPHGR